MTVTALGAAAVSSDRTQKCVARAFVVIVTVSVYYQWNTSPHKHKHTSSRQYLSTETAARLIQPWITKQLSNSKIREHAHAAARTAFRFSNWRCEGQTVSGLFNLYLVLQQLWQLRVCAVGIVNSKSPRIRQLFNDSWTYQMFLPFPCNRCNSNDICVHVCVRMIFISFSFDWNRHCKAQSLR